MSKFDDIKKGLLSSRYGTGAPSSPSTGSSWDTKVATISGSLSSLITSTTGLIGTIKGAGVPGTMIDEPIPATPQRNNSMTYLIIGVGVAILLLFFLKNK